MQNAGARELRADEYERVAERHLKLISPDATPLSERRTVRITGQPVPARRRPPRTQTRIEARPDRVALWAVGMGMFLVLMAIVTAGA